MKSEDKAHGSNTYIQVEAASFKYKKSDFHLESIDLELSLGEIVFLKGQNGSGKTTLGKLIAGILKVEQGKITIDGKNVRELSLGEIGEMVGYLWQKPEQQLFASTVIEELTFASEIRGEGREEVLARARHWLKTFELEKYQDRSSFNLSRGEKQRLALASVMMEGCKFLILDEPTTGLDEKRIEQLLMLLKRLRKEERVGMLIISHHSGFIEELADRVVEISKGELKLK